MNESPEDRGRRLGIVKLPRGDSPAGEREFAPLEGDLPVAPTPVGVKPKTPASRFPLVKFSDVVMSTTSADLVKGLIPGRVS
jgi:hypothetical protein